jgi:REP element-mobilizing transposase RayT/DNA-binding transcriptional ArsR family regulator
MGFMSRPLRIEIENGIYHVTARGWERRVVVRDDRDRQEWFKLLDRVTVRCGWRFFAWVLLNNHFHLFFQTPEANLSAGMHDLNSGYATWFNRRHRRSGSLFQGRFKAILVEDESYCWTLSRYIHLNPVRAKIVNRPEDHSWSSYRYYLRSGNAPEWLDWQRVLAEVGKKPRSARREYQRFVEQGLKAKIASPLEDVVGKVFLGSDAWVEKMQKALGLCEPDANVPQLKRLAWRPSQNAIETAVAAAFGIDVPNLFVKRVKHNEPRVAALYLLRKLTSVSAAELAEQYGGVSQAAISKTVTRAQLRAKEERHWRQRLTRIEESLRP